MVHYAHTQPAPPTTKEHSMPTKADLRATIERLQHAASLQAKAHTNERLEQRQRQSWLIAAGYIPVDLLIDATIEHGALTGPETARIVVTDHRVIEAIIAAAKKQEAKLNDFDRILHGDPLSGFFGGRA